MFVHTFLRKAGILCIVKPPNTLYVTPHKNKITSPETDSTGCPFCLDNQFHIIHDSFYESLNTIRLKGK